MTLSSAFALFALTGSPVDVSRVGNEGYFFVAVKGKSPAIGPYRFIDIKRKIVPSGRP